MASMASMASISVPSGNDIHSFFSSANEGARLNQKIKIKFGTREGVSFLSVYSVSPEAVGRWPGGYRRPYEKDKSKRSAPKGGNIHQLQNILVSRKRWGHPSQGVIGIFNSLLKPI